MNYKLILNNIVQEYSTEEIIQICKYLNKEYNIYDPEEVRWKKISSAFFKTPQEEIIQLNHTALSNEIVNELLMKYYVCERVVKYHFIKKLKNTADNIIAFEMSIGDSRIDICRLNGGSYAYEIKTEYDNFDRLNSQMRDYFKAFEKVYVIVPNSRVEGIKNYIPYECGIISYRLDKKFNMIFSYVRSAKKNNCDIEFCLSCLSSYDMTKFLKLLNYKSFNNKEKNLKLLIDISSKKNIWSKYRVFLKKKYEEQWHYLKEHFHDILPIDIQNFFSSQVNPDILYNKTQKIT